MEIELFSVTLKKNPSGFGFSIVGGKDCEQYGREAEFIYVSYIEEGLCGRLQVGDKIVQVVQFIMDSNGSQSARFHFCFLDK